MFILNISIDDDDPIDIALIEQPFSSESDSSGDQINRRDNEEDSDRRAAERRLLRENNPLANLEAITQRLGRDAAERFRSMLEERKNETQSRVNSRIAITFLRNYLSESDLESIEDKKEIHVRKIVKWFGDLGGILIVRLKKMKYHPLAAEYE